MAEKKHNLYTAIADMINAPAPKKPRVRSDNEEKKFNLYTQMGWVKPSAPNKRKK